MERAAILSETDTFFDEESWLKHESAESQRSHEVEMIVVALAECRGRISGQSGAIAKLGTSRQTLESKIRHF